VNEAVSPVFVVSILGDSRLWLMTGGGNEDEDRKRVPLDAAAILSARKLGQLEGGSRVPRQSQRLTTQSGGRSR
jgi:hypothetical protein